MQPDLSIIILNWRSVDYLGSCLESINYKNSALTLEIIVADGASYDGSDNLIAQRFPEVKFVQLTENRGFAWGNNQAARHATADTLLFLNPDTLVLENAIDKLYAAYISNPNRGIAGLTLLNSNETLQTSAIQAYPTILNQVLDFDFFLNTFKTLPLWGNAALYRPDPSHVQVVSGACLMIRADLFQQIGGFDERYFMYAEDAHLCWETARRGFSVMFYPVGKVIHHGGGSSKNKKVSNISSRTFRHSIFLFLKATRGEFYAQLYRYSIWICAVGRIGCLSLLNLLRPGLTNNSIEKWKQVMLWAQAPFKA